MKSPIIEIKKPWWKTWCFYFITIISGLILLYAFIKKIIQREYFRNHTILERNQLKTDLILSKLEAIRSQMNPHFLFNALNSIQIRWFGINYAKSRTNSSIKK